MENILEYYSEMLDARIEEPQIADWLLDSFLYKRRMIGVDNMLDQLFSVNSQPELALELHNAKKQLYEDFRYFEREEGMIDGELNALVERFTS